MDRERIGKMVLDCAYKVHTALGPGLLESCYEACIEYELRQCGLRVERQKDLPVKYGAVLVDAGFRVDLLVEDCVVVELKSVKELNDLFFAQTLTYLKLGGYELGYIINFNTTHLKNGIRRVVN